jgi:Fe-S cluster assembly protein SufB
MDDRLAELSFAEQMIEPEWANVATQTWFSGYFLLFSTKADPNKTLDDVDPELLEMYKS